MKILIALLFLFPLWLSAQNHVGINTNAPISDLDVRGQDDVNDGGELQLATPSSTNFLRFFSGRLGDPNPFLAFSKLDTFRIASTHADWSNFTRWFTIQPDGKVGIGIDKPLSKLDIQATGNGAELLRFTTDRPWVFKQTQTGINTTLTLQSSTNDKAFEILSENGLNRAARFFTNNTYSKVLLVPEGGEVGIGIDEAEAKLHVKGNSTIADPHLRLTETTPDDYARIKMENENEPGIGWDIAGKADSSAAASRLNFFYLNPGFTGDKMTITGEGNVGIGTTSPGNRLRVNGSTTSSQHVLSASTNYSGPIHIRAFEGFSTPATGYGVGGYMLGGAKGIEAIGSGGSYTGTVIGAEGYATGTAGTHIGVYGWATGGTTNWAGRFGFGNVWVEHDLRIDGDVGIGTTTPATTLDVNGKIKIGNDADTPQAGMIRWNTTTADFEGYDGSQWLSLTIKGNSGGWGNAVAEASENYQGMASDGAAQDEFGSSCSISGNYAIIGAPLHNTNGNADRGKAYIFFFNGTTWTQQAILIASDGAASDNFGESVSIDGSYALVGASGHQVNGHTGQGAAYVYVRNGTVWTQQAILTSSDGVASDNFGCSVSISGTFALVGADRCDYGGQTDRGKAYMFERNGSTWSQYSILTTSDGAAGDWCGNAVALSGLYAVIGAPNFDQGGMANRGKAYLHAWNGSSWPVQASLIANDGASVDFFGSAVSISGDYAVVGSGPHDSEGYTDKGKVYVYTRSGSTWPQTHGLTAMDGMPDDLFGESVFINGDYLIVGASHPNLGGTQGKGKAYIYVRTGSAWNQKAKLIASQGVLNDEFGASCAISANQCLVGAPQHDTAGQLNRGKIYFFAHQ